MSVRTRPARRPHHVCMRGGTKIPFHSPKTAEKVPVQKREKHEKGRRPRALELRHTHGFTASGQTVDAPGSLPEVPCMRTEGNMLEPQAREASTQGRTADLQMQAVGHADV